MLYCPDCMRLTAEEHCPNCRGGLRPPKPDDPVYLTEKDMLWSAVVADMLQQSGIPFLKRGLLGEGVTSRLGYAWENYRFFVPFGAYQKALAMLEELPSEAPSPDEAGEGPDLLQK